MSEKKQKKKEIKKLKRSELRLVRDTISMLSSLCHGRDPSVLADPRSDAYDIWLIASGLFGCDGKADEIFPIMVVRFNDYYPHLERLILTFERICRDAKTCLQFLIGDDQAVDFHFGLLGTMEYVKENHPHLKDSFHGLIEKVEWMISQESIILPTVNDDLVIIELNKMTTNVSLPEGAIMTVDPLVLAVNSGASYDQAACICDDLVENGLLMPVYDFGRTRYTVDTSDNDPMLRPVFIEIFDQEEWLFSGRIESESRYEKVNGRHFFVMEMQRYPEETDQTISGDFIPPRPSNIDDQQCHVMEDSYTYRFMMSIMNKASENAKALMPQIFARMVLQNRFQTTAQRLWCWCERDLIEEFGGMETIDELRSLNVFTHLNNDGEQIAIVPCCIEKVAKIAPEDENFYLISIPSSFERLLAAASKFKANNDTALIFNMLQEQITGKIPGS